MSNITSESGGWQSPEAYCEHIEHYLSLGWEPVPPSTVVELHAALEKFPKFARRWLPSQAECEWLGIDASEILSNVVDEVVGLGGDLGED